MINELKKYIMKNDLTTKAVDWFWVAFNNWKSDNPMDFEKKFDGVPLDALHVFVHSIGLRASEWPDCDYNHVTVTILIHYNDRSLANYVIWFSLSDDVDDDDFLEIM